MADNDRRYISFEELVAYKKEADIREAQEAGQDQAEKEARLDSLEITFEDDPPVETRRLYRLFQILANEKRLEILEVLMDRPATAGQLARELDEPPNRLTRHLALIEMGGLASVERSGSIKIFRIQDWARAVLEAAVTQGASQGAEQGDEAA